MAQDPSNKVVLNEKKEDKNEKKEEEIPDTIDGERLVGNLNYQGSNEDVLRKVKLRVLN